MRSTPQVALTGSQLDPRLVRLVRLVRPFPQGAVWKFLSGIDRLGMAELLKRPPSRNFDFGLDQAELFAPRMGRLNCKKAQAQCDAWGPSWGATMRARAWESADFP